MKYLKKFGLINDYIIWKNSNNYIAPNVSMIDNDNGEDDIINYNPLIIINPSVTMNDWIYGETASNPSISGNRGNGTVTYLYKVSSADDSTYTSTKPTDAGTYTIKANINAIRDYSAGSCTSTFTISKANINPSVTMNNWTYGETASNPVISGNTGNGTVTYMYKISSADDSTYTSTKPSNAGTYTVRATIQQTNNYNGATCTSTFTIAKANINPSVTIEDWDEGDTASNPVISGNTGNGTVTYMYKVSSADDSTYTSTVPSIEGTYTIKATIDATSNYNGATCTTTFTIIKVNNNKIITYTALSKLPENNNSNGLHTNAFNTTIKSHIFENGIGTIEFNDDVTSIGTNAFRGCSGLTSITIPDLVTSIGDSAFESCSGLTSITIPNSVTSIGNFAFAYCTILTSVTIGNSVTSIGNQAFNGCSGLTSITIPNSVTSIGNSAFYNCSGLTSITIDSNNQYYDSRNNCNAIIETATNKLIRGCQNTIIPNGVTSIEFNAFYNCSGLTSITIPNGVTSIEFNAFKNCSGLTSVTIPDSVTSIGYAAFQYCSGLTSVTIGNSVTSIGNSAFNGCSRLTSINIPDSVTVIGNYAFKNCSGLTSVTIGNSMRTICSQAFQDCSNLTSITINTLNAPDIFSDTFKGVGQNGILTVPLGANGYGTWLSINANYLGYYSWIYPMDESYDIYKIEATYDVTSTSSNTQICGNYSKIYYMEVDGEEKTPSGTYLFNSTGLHTVKFITKDLSKINENLFSSCSNLTFITIPNGIKTIGNFAFNSCSNLLYIKCNATTAPSITGASSTLSLGIYNKCGILEVPQSNSGYDRWMSELTPRMWEKVIDNGTFGTQELTGLYWSKDSITVTSNYASLPTLTKPSGITVTYASSDTSKATINSSGTVTLRGSSSSNNDGYVYITAFFAGNSTYRPKKVWYQIEIDMYTPPSSGGGSYGGGE